MVGRVVGGVDCRLEVLAQVVRRALDGGLVDGGHVGGVHASGAGVGVVTRRRRSRRRREVAVSIRSVDVWRAVGEHVCGRHESNGARDLTPNDGPAVAVTCCATHWTTDGGSIGLLAAGGEGTNERHFVC